MSPQTGGSYSPVLCLRISLLVKCSAAWAQPHFQGGLPSRVPTGSLEARSPSESCGLNSQDYRGHVCDRARQLRSHGHYTHQPMGTKRSSPCARGVTSTCHQGQLTLITTGPCPSWFQALEATVHRGEGRAPMSWAVPCQEEMSSQGSSLLSWEFPLGLPTPTHWFSSCSRHSPLWSHR